MAYDDVEAELCSHPKVRECVVTRIQTGPRKNMLVAYVVTTVPIDPAEVRAFLPTPRLRPDQIPRAVIPVDFLPRTSSGELDREGLPLPVLPGQAAGGKGALSDFGGAPFGVLMMPLAGVIAVALVAFLMTHIFWPGSTDLSVVPQPFAGLFTGLYVAECLSFGLGISFFVPRPRPVGPSGTPAMVDHARPPVDCLAADRLVATG